MTPMKDMNRTDLVELVAAVFLRIFAFSYAIEALRYAYHLARFLTHDAGPNGTYVASGYFMDIAYNVLMAAAMFFLSLPLARLLCRGLYAVEVKPAD
jgi:hypothetical protein